MKGSFFKQYECCRGQCEGSDEEEQELSKRKSITKKLLDLGIVDRGATIEINTIEKLYDVSFCSSSDYEWRFILLSLMDIICINFNMLCTTKKRGGALYIYKKNEESTVSRSTRDNYLSKISAVNRCMSSGDTSELNCHEAKRHEHEQMRINNTLAREMTEKAFKDI